MSILWQSLRIKSKQYVSMLEKVLLVLFCFVHQAQGGGDPACNGKGLVFSDTGLCNCFQCYTGSNCTTFTKDCQIIDEGGNPVVYDGKM